MGPARFLCATLLKDVQETTVPIVFLLYSDLVLVDVMKNPAGAFLLESFVGELAQMVERSICIREVAGSMPAFSRHGVALFPFVIGIIV